MFFCICTQADSEVPDTHVEVDVAPPPRRHSRAWLNLFLILVAILVLAAGITGGVLLYKRLSHKVRTETFPFLQQITSYYVVQMAECLSLYQLIHINIGHCLAGKPKDIKLSSKWEKINWSSFHNIYACIVQLNTASKLLTI